MMKPYLLICILFLSACAISQETDPIATDRPDQTETPLLVPPKMFQIETGIAYEDSKNGTSITPSILWKYGVNENFELRLITEVTFENLSQQKTSGLMPILVGFKSRIAEEKGFWPQTSIIAHLALPHPSAPEYKPDYYAPEFRFTMQHTLGSRMSLSYNLGAEWNGFTPEPTFIYTLATGYSISENMGTFIELYGFAHGHADHRADAGLTYLISPNAMIDLSGGVGITENAPDFFVAAGFSFRI